jgi:hypothetical protein
LSFIPPPSSCSVTYHVTSPTLAIVDETYAPDHVSNYYRCNTVPV